MDGIEEAQQANEILNKTVDKFIARYKEIQSQIKEKTKENTDFQRKIDELRRKS